MISGTHDAATMNSNLDSRHTATTHQSDSGTSMVLFDVGARGGAGKEWMPFSKDLDVVLFDPDPIECKRILSAKHSYNSLRAIPVALSDSSKATQFYVTRNPQCSSLLQPNSVMLRDRYPVFSKHFEVARETVINTIRLDQAIVKYELPKPDFLKLDVQGAEGLILAGLGEYLGSVKALRLETHLRNLYLNEQMFWDLHTWLNDAGFELRRILTDKSRRFRGGEIVEMDVFYVNSTYQRARSPQTERDKLLIAMKAWDMLPEK